MPSQLLSYEILTWVALVAITLMAARWGHVPGVFLGHLLVAAIIAGLDVAWIQGEMHKPGWNGDPDQDGIFLIGWLIRVVLINSVLLSVSLLGLYAFNQRQVGCVAKSL